MTGDPVDLIARTLLYEGYWLYPYRRSSVKNQHRFNFGVLYPQGYVTGTASLSSASSAATSASPSGSDAWRLQMQCPVAGTAETRVRVTVRFLQLAASHVTGDPQAWYHEAIERDVTFYGAALGALQRTALRRTFTFPRFDAATGQTAREDGVCGVVEVAAEEARPQAYRLTVHLWNAWAGGDIAGWTRSDALLRSLVSAHVVVRVECGELVSLFDPPEPFRDIVRTCANQGVWPVLVGDESRQDCMLASPIILYDYPTIAPESAGDLFDGTEIDEILALRILTLTDDEKREARDGDARVREILDRTDALGPQQWAKLHGAVRGLRKATEGP